MRSDGLRVAGNVNYDELGQNGPYVMWRGLDWPPHSVTGVLVLYAVASAR